MLVRIGIVIVRGIMKTTLPIAIAEIPSQSQHTPLDVVPNLQSFSLNASEVNAGTAAQP